MTSLIGNTMSRFVAEGQIAGCSAKIIRGGETLFQGSFGYADIEKQKPMDDTIPFAWSPWRIRRSRRRPHRRRSPLCSSAGTAF